MPCLPACLLGVMPCPCLSHASSAPNAVRKGYHLLAVSLFLPALLLEPQLLGVALAAAFALLLAVEALRLSGVPGIGMHSAAVPAGWLRISALVLNSVARLRVMPRRPSNSRP